MRAEHIGQKVSFQRVERLSVKAGVEVLDRCIVDQDIRAETPIGDVSDERRKFGNWRASSCKRASWRATPMISAPSAQNSSTASRPIPREAPVKTMRRPTSCFMARAYHESEMIRALR
jgi:hypothetical protein